MISETQNPQYFIADMNSDGFVDIVTINSNDVVVTLSSGKGLYNESKSLLYDPLRLKAASQRDIVDINGDGIADLVAFFKHGIMVATNEQEHFQLVETEDSFGIKNRFSYGSLTNGSLYRISNCSYFQSYPYAEITKGIRVVKELKMDNGIGGFNYTRFKYEGFLFDVSRRIDMGFKKIEISSEKENLVIEFLQVFPLISIETKKYHYIDGKLISFVNLLYNNSTFSQRSPQGYQVLPFKKIEKIYDYDLEKLLINRYEIYNYDLYGNEIFKKLEITSPTNSFDHYEIQWQTVFNINEENWHINQLKEKTIKYIFGNSTIERLTLFEVDQSDRKIHCEKKEPNEILSIIRKFEYDKNGNIIKDNLIPKELPDDNRTTWFEFFNLQEPSRLRYKWNALGHKEEYTYDYFGRLSLKHVGQITTAFEYDEWGREKYTGSNLGMNETIDYNWDNSMKFSVYRITKKQTFSPTVINIYDKFNRIIRTIKESFNGELVYMNFEYDNAGRVVYETLPFVGDKKLDFNIHHYDNMGRETKLTRVRKSNTYNLTTIIEYNGLKQTKINPKGAKTVYTKDIFGRIQRVVDANGGTIEYLLDAEGKILQTTDPKGNKILITYDVFGNKIETDDPDLGVWIYGYNAFGEQINQTDAKGQKLFRSFDKVGRLKQIKAGDISSEFYYNDKLGKEGKLVFMNNTEGFAKEFQYDSLGRLIQEVTKLNSLSTYKISINYIVGEIVASKNYPNGITVYHCYNDRGFLVSLSKVSCNSPLLNGFYWRALKADTYDRITLEQSGNGLWTVHDYSDSTHLTAEWTIDSYKKILRSWKYEYDSQSNVVKRIDGTPTWNSTESFEYDALDRLTRTSITSDLLYNEESEEFWQYDSTGMVN